MSPLSIEWCGVTIYYREHDNCWCFQMSENDALRNRSSLADAKKAVSDFDKKKGKFEQFVVLQGPGGVFPTGAEITVTSIPNSTQVRGTHDGENKTVYGAVLVEDTPENRALLADYVLLENESRELERRKDAINKKLTKYTIPFEK